MKEFPVQKKSEIGEKNVKVPKDVLDSIKKHRFIESENNKCPYCKKEHGLERKFFVDMLKHKLFVGRVPCRSCGKMVEIGITKKGELCSIKEGELTLKEIEELDF